MTALIPLRREALSRTEIEWDEWWVRSWVRLTKPWWRRVFSREPKLPGWDSRITPGVGW